MKKPKEAKFIEDKYLLDELRVIKNKIRHVTDEEKKALLSFRRMAHIILKNTREPNEKA